MCKIIDICIINDSDMNKDFAVNYYCELALGDFPHKKLFIKKEVGTDRITVRNLYNDIFDGYAVLSCDRECTFRFSKTAFLCNCDSGNDTFDCLIAERKLSLKANSSVNVRFCLSYGNSNFSAIKMPYVREKHINENRITIETPDKNLDNFFNGFLLHQIVNGRIFARTGFYQCSGAYGFRDQLQDAMSVAITHPEILRTQILYCCEAQFTQGDVLHWFHQLYFDDRRVLRGVRTLYSDDLLWLPLAVSEYCRVSGDLTILDINVPYLDAPILEKGEIERFGEFTKSKIIGTVYNHCINAITHACKFGEHSLPLIKGGDWNDSFNSVGIRGKGESVWLGMFLSYTLKNFASLCDIKNDKKTAETMRILSKKLLEATDAHAWDKDRYLRCFYDDGTPMGKEGNNECAIDLLPQAWSVISGMPDKKRCRIAVDTAYSQLVDKENGIIKLFTPPFNEKSKKTGYVNRYPEGVRENGGQYTHGATWLAQAYFMLNEPSTGYELIKILNPANKPYDKYKTEPYYLAGDVYSAQGMEGRGGWSIYTGSAGWFYRIIVENMFGIIKRKYDIKTNPRLHEELRGSRVKIQLNGNTREFKF